ncbi:MAG TPA: cytochrome c3 family protein, partial [Bacillota bacterium]|nr:cytochrome c3 family protein [Bacillota bacterium]
MKTRLGIFTIIAIMVWITLTGIAFAIPPGAYISYSNQASEPLTLTVCFGDPDGKYDRAAWAVSPRADGSDLDWQPLAVEDNGVNKSAQITDASKFMNYFFKIYSSDPTVTEAAYLRAFPVEVGGSRITNDYAHGSYQQNTSMCGNCHTTHSALKDKLLVRASYYELCMVCHSNANTQSKYDVETGQVAVAGNTTKPSLAGPFVTSVTSRHDADDTNGIVAVNVPGSDLSGTKRLGLTCLSCHVAHGGNNDNYR